jgi:hypothetical protein
MLESLAGASKCFNFSLIEAWPLMIASVMLGGDTQDCEDRGFGERFGKAFDGDNGSALRAAIGGADSESGVAVAVWMVLLLLCTSSGDLSASSSAAITTQGTSVSRTQLHTIITTKKACISRIYKL